MNKFFALMAVIAACGLFACGGQPKTLTQEQLAVAAKLSTAPTRTIVIYDSKQSNGNWGIVCSHSKNGEVSVTLVGHGGVWMCGSAAAMTSPESPNELARYITRIIEPGDPDYNGQIEKQMFLMLDPQVHKN